MSHDPSSSSATTTTLNDLGLFTGVPQHENFGRLDELLHTRAMAPSRRPHQWEVGEPVDLPESFDLGGRTRSVEAFLHDTDTAALLVIQDGAIRHERYLLTGGMDVPWLSMSVAKSFVSALVGIAVAEGDITDVEDPISDYVPVEPGSAYDGVAIRSVLQMSSGARWHEDYSDPASDVRRIANATSGVAGDHDTIVATMVRENEPDTVCRYNSCDTQALAALVRRATGRHLADYMQTRLCEPLGFSRPGYWIVDRAGVEMGYGGLNLVARDYATIGELYRNGGSWDGSQIVPASWVRSSTTVTAPHLRPGAVRIGNDTLDQGYGYQWWIPEGNRGEFMAVGVYNQFVYVDPISRVTIVKLSANRRYGISTDEADNREDETLAFLRAVARRFD